MMDIQQAMNLVEFFLNFYIELESTTFLKNELFVF